MAERYSVLLWVPDDDPRPGRLHDRHIGWNLERDVLDWLFPQANGNPRSAKTDGYRHRNSLKKKLQQAMLSWPPAVVIAATTAVSKDHYRTAMKLQRECELVIIMRDPGAAVVQVAGGLEQYLKPQGAKRRKRQA